MMERGGGDGLGVRGTDGLEVGMVLWVSLRSAIIWFRWPGSGEHFVSALGEGVFEGLPSNDACGVWTVDGFVRPGLFDIGYVR